MKTKKLSALVILVFSMLIIMSTLVLPASAAKSISKATVSVASAIYTGKALKPEVTVKLSGKKLATKYYTVSYTNNKNIGTGTVTVKGKNGYSGTVKKTFKIVPNKVSGVTVTPDTTSAKVSWKKVSGATTYQVYVYIDGEWVRKASTKELSAKITGLESGTTYAFKVRAYKKVSSTNYIGAFSSTVKATTKLGAPASIKASASESSITVSWSKVSGATHYQLWVHDGEDWTVLSNTNKTKYTLSDAQKGTTYTFRVRAYIKNGSSKTYGNYSSKIKATTLVASVTNLTVSEVTETGAEFSWTASKGADSYVVTLTDDNAEKQTFKTSGTTYTVSGLTAATVYNVSVKAYSKASASYSKDTSVSFATSPKKPSDVLTSNITEASADLKWSLTSDATGSVVYLLTLDKTGETLQRSKLKSVTTTSYSASSLESATKYRFQVYSYIKCDGKNYYSEPAYSDIFTTHPGQVKNLKALTNETTVSLTWTLQSGVDGYEVYDDAKNLLDELSASTQIYTIYSLTEGSTYTFYVRSFIKDSNGNKVYGAYTAVSVTTTSSKVSGVSFTQKTTTMSVGQTYQTEVKVEPDSAKNTAVAYSSTDVNVAMIDKTGLITAVAEGVTKITVTTEDGGFSDSFTLRVENVKLQSVSVNASYSVYVNESVTIVPTFTPSTVSDKSFTLSGSDYTYSYKGGLFGTTTKTDTCKFTDYFYIDNTIGRLLAKKATIEPETGNAFSFTVTLNASNGKSTTFKVSSTKKLISIYYAGEDNPWYYGNSVKLSADIDSSAGFGADSLKWSSSNTSIAKVSDNGTVTCVGTGEVTITAASPVGSKSHSITFYVSPVIKLTKDYYENCAVGQSYQLNVSTSPSNAATSFNYLSSDPSVATVSSTGKVTFNKEGYVYIHVSSATADKIMAVLTTGSATLPDGGKMKLLSTLETSTNKIKTAMPALYVSKLPTFTNVKMENEGSLKTADLVGIFESFAASESRYIPKVSYTNYPSTEQYNSAHASYLNSVPVSGQPYTIVPGLEDSDIRSITVIDNGSYTYDIKMVLNDELLDAPPSKPQSTAHGKVFDVLSASYMEIIQEGLSASSASMKYTAFKQTYNNCSLTVSYNKVTGEITNMVYDMNVKVEAIDLKLSMSLITAINSTISFDVNNRIEYEVKY